MHIEKPFLSNAQEISRRNSIVTGLRDLAEIIEDRQLVPDQWQTPQVSVTFNDRGAFYGEVMPLVEEADDTSLIQVYVYNSQLQVRYPVSGVLIYANSTSLDAEVVLFLQLRATEDAGDVRMLSGYSASYPYDGTVTESYIITWSEDNFDSIEAFFRAHGVKVEDQRRAMTPEALEQSRVTAQEYADKKHQDVSDA